MGQWAQLPQHGLIFITQFCLISSFKSPWWCFFLDLMYVSRLTSISSAVNLKHTWRWGQRRFYHHSLLHFVTEEHRFRCQCQHPLPTRPYCKCSHENGTWKFQSYDEHSFITYFFAFITAAYDTTANDFFLWAGLQVRNVFVHCEMIIIYNDIIINGTERAKIWNISTSARGVYYWIADCRWEKPNHCQMMPI